MRKGVLNERPFPQTVSGPVPARSRYKAWVSAASEDAAIAFVEDALDNGHDLDATVYDGENEVVCAIEIDEGGAP